MLCARCNQPGDFYARGRICKRCIKERAREWAAKNPERRAEIRRKSAVKHREKKRVASKALYWKIKREDPERLREASRRWAHIRRSRELGNGGFISGSWWKALLDVFETNVCLYCGENTERLVMDHFVPVKLGGRTEVGNLLPCCAICNNAKRASAPDVWVPQHCGADAYESIKWFLALTKEAHDESRATHPGIEHREI